MNNIIFKLFSWLIFQMTEHSSKTNNLYPNLLDDQQFRLNKINEIRDCFVAEIKERESMSKRISKYTAF